MSLRVGMIAGVSACLFAVPLHAQDEDRFAVQAAGSKTKTDIVGSLTSTSFYYVESGEPVDYGGQEPIDLASPTARFFTDLRSRLDLLHLGGGSWSFESDVRLRLAPDTVQAGLYGGPEYDLRTFNVQRKGAKWNWAFGRQYSMEVAATKFDGLKLERVQSKVWRYHVFGGLYPARGSRSLTDDYPRQLEGFNGGEPQFGQRLFPIEAGAGARYRFRRLYGSFGVGGILPQGNDYVDNENPEAPRIFLSSSGYWNQGSKLDVYHYLVFDATGADGAMLTNISVGANYVPIRNLQVSLSGHHVDTETLNIAAQTRIEDPNGALAGVIINNLEVLRIAQQSARLGVSANFLKNRFEVSTAGSYRRRPAINLNGGEVAVNLDAAQAGEVSFGVADRRSVLGLRLGASYARSFAIGNENANRGEYQVVQASASRQLFDERADAELDLTYLASRDDGVGTSAADCLGNINVVDTCYGTSAVRTASSTMLFSMRVGRNWLAALSASAGVQSATASDSAGDDQAQPPIYIFSGLARLSYRY